MEEIAYVPEKELFSIEAFDHETIEELRQRARNKLLADAITREENLRKADPKMLALEGMDNDLANKLVARGVKTLDDLGDLAVEELVEMTGLMKSAPRSSSWVPRSAMRPRSSTRI